MRFSAQEIYKFEKIKPAKRAALAQFPERQLLDFGIGENDEVAASTVRYNLPRSICSTVSLIKYAK